MVPSLPSLHKSSTRSFPFSLLALTAHCQGPVLFSDTLAHSLSLLDRLWSLLLLLTGTLDELQTCFITLPCLGLLMRPIPSPIFAHPAQILQDSALVDEGTACAGVTVSTQPVTRTVQPHACCSLKLTTTATSQGPSPQPTTN